MSICNINKKRTCRILNFDIISAKVGKVIGDQIVHPTGAVRSIDPGNGRHRDLRGQGHTALKMPLQAVLLDQLSAVVAIERIPPQLLGGITGLDQGKTFWVVYNRNIIGDELPAPAQKLRSQSAFACTGVAGQEDGAVPIGDTAR